MKTLASTTIALVLLTVAPPVLAGGDAVVIEGAWSRASIGTSRPGVAYMRLQNTGDALVTVTGLRTDLAMMPMIHTSTTDAQGVNRMSHLEQVEIAAGESIHYIYAETEYVNPYAMLEMGEKYGVITRRWTDEQIAVFEKAWLEVLKEDSANDPLFKKVADSYLAFRKTYSKWGTAQALKPTYLD